MPDIQRPHKTRADAARACTVPATDLTVCTPANAVNEGELPAYVEPYVGIRTPPQTYCNMTTQGTYSGTAWSVRPGADDHLRHLSRGVRV